MKTARCLALGLVGALPLCAADFQVATNGADTAAGSAAHPFRTIQKGLEAAGQPGDTVTVLPGVYAEELSLHASGTPDKPILLKAAQPQSVILPWPMRTDYVGNPLDADRPPSMGHIQGGGTGGK